jgi:putative ABC transport system permease protein
MVLEPLARGWPDPVVHMDIWPSLSITVGAFLLSVTLGIAFGIYPAAKASKLQPVEALRAE